VQLKHRFRGEWSSERRDCDFGDFGLHQKPAATSSRDRRGQINRSHIRYYHFATLRLRHSPKGRSYKMPFTTCRVVKRPSQGTHSHYRRRWFCPHAAPRLTPIQLRNTIYRHKHHVMRRIRLHRKESSNMNLRIQVSWSGTRTTESTLGIGRRCINARSRSSWNMVLL
jgi:hypothetical protein